MFEGRSSNFEVTWKLEGGSWKLEGRSEFEEDATAAVAPRHVEPRERPLRGPSADAHTVGALHVRWDRVDVLPVVRPLSKIDEAGRMHHRVQLVAQFHVE